MNPYLLDSNFFIQAHRAYYPLDVASSFWAKVAELAKLGTIRSIDKVKIEIYDNSSHEDDLKEWCINHLPNDFFLSSGSSISKYAAIAAWAVSSNHYQQSAIQEFLAPQLADPWLVAYALENNLTIVTYEKSEPNRKSRIKIPEVCNHFDVKYTNTVGMLRELDEKF